MAIYKSGSGSDTTTSRLVEQRLREWAMGLEAERRAAESASAAELSLEIHPYIAISRQAGAGGASVAGRVGELLGWDVLHRELLDQIAEKTNLPRHLLDLVDEKTSSWLVEVFGKWLDPRLVTHSEYIRHLGEVVLLAAQHSSKVFVGRGAQFFLPRDRGVTVFLVAPLPQRVRHIREIQDCSEAEARRYIRETDKGRRDLIKSHFNREIGDPCLYDLVINREKISEDAAAQLIVYHFRQLFAEA